MTALPSAASDDPADASYRQLFEQNAAVQLVVDPTSGAILDANRAAAEFYAGPLSMPGAVARAHDRTRRDRAVRAEDAARELHAKREPHQRTVEPHAQLQRQARRVARGAAMMTDTQLDTIQVIGAPTFLNEAIMAKWRPLMKRSAPMRPRTRRPWSSRGTRIRR